MDQATIICSNCGATCKATDEYCKRCWKKLGGETVSNVPIVDGMSEAEWTEWEEFIGKNADRYIEVYKKNHNKKFFAYINWSAFFFGLNWVLYRRMFKFAVIGFVVSSLLFSLLFAMFLLPHRAEVRSLKEDIEPYESYLERGGQTILIDSESPESLRRGLTASQKLGKIVAKAQLFSFIFIPLTCVFWGLFGNSVYKMHIKQKIRGKNGGTSFAELFGGRILLLVVGWVLVDPLTSLLTAILIG